MKIAVDEMYKLFLQFTKINTHDQNDPEIMLPSGKAISPASAAHCLLEMKRTAKFLRGINQAILKKLDKKKSIHILYAGCGPYATLITPLLTLFSANKIKIDLLDINKVSLGSAKSVINGFQFEKYIEDYILEDASEIQLEKQYDIIISETLQTGLRNEPLVAIMQNLASQINRDCIFIPEEVTVDAKLNTKGYWNPDSLKVENEERIELGDIIKVNIKNVLSPFKPKKIALDYETPEKVWELKLYTTIKTFDSNELTEGDCSLNFPLKIDEFKEGLKGDIELWYDQSYPVEIKYKTYNSAFVS
jgi:predicted RNA methylase